MKKLTLCLSLAVLLLAGCRHEIKDFDRFETASLSGEQWYFITCASEWDSDTGSMKNSYDIVWPEEGWLSPAAMRELMFRYFDDSTSATIEEAANRWLESVVYYADPDNNCIKKRVDSSEIPMGEYCYYHLESTCERDSNLVTFVINTDCYWAGAAHGLYSSTSVVADLNTGEIVHLTDLVADTNLLCEAIAHAIQDLEVNKEVRECLFDEFRNVERMPMPEDFFIDSTRSTIVVNYGLYHIAPYACGIQSVVLPIFWLSKHVALTPYAKRLFGPGSSLTP